MRARRWLVGAVVVLLLAAGVRRLLRVARPPAPVPAAATGTAGPVRTLARPEALSETRRSLKALADSGASEEAVSQARSLIAQLGGTPDLAGALESALAFLDGRENHAVQPPAGMDDALTRAAAACYERGRAKPDEILLSFAGDCTFGSVNGDGGPGRFPSVYRRSGRADYPFANVRPWFLTDDLTVVNFEGTLTDATKTAEKQWHFKGPAGYARIFPAAAVETVILANNHAFDYLQAGFDDTARAFQAEHVGVIYQNSPYVTTLKGTEVVLIGDCSVIGENTTVTTGVAERVLRQIESYKKPDNLVVVVMHWGSELDKVPTRWQQETGRRFIDAGADAVVGQHPHVLQGIESYKGRVIAYSLGNFAFGGNSRAHFPETLILRLRFGPGASFRGASIVPCLVTSSRRRGEKDVLRNDYQPRPLFGPDAAKVTDLLLQRSAVLPYGIQSVDTFDPTHGS